MSFDSVNPATGETFASTDAFTAEQLERAVAGAAAAAESWALVSMKDRCRKMRQAGVILRQRTDKLANLMSLEMGKLLEEARDEVEKCAWVCDYYADHAAEHLADETFETDAGRSLVTYQPLGVVLAIMPWNFPFWQVMRFAAPNLCAGNTGLLKHASNVMLTAQAIEDVFHDAGFPEGVFTNLPVSSDAVEGLLEDDRIAAATLTGSEPAGRAVAEAAGRNLKKTVLELGGSDAFIVLADADLASAASTGAKSRFKNAGQSCIAAKRFLVVEEAFDEFIAKFKQEASELQSGDPQDEATTLAPMARTDLRDEVHEQVQDALEHGASAVLGCKIPDRSGAFYPASILSELTPEMRVWEEEVFGPVALVIRVDDADHAIEVANEVSFGLGGSVWTRDTQTGESLARQLECGCAFVNEMVKSDPRLPFGGIKNSGFGRELSRAGIREFVNTKTLWIDPAE